MRAPARLLGVVALGAILWSWAPRAAAEPRADGDTAPPRAFSLVYDAPAACPSRDELLAAVEARRPRRASRSADTRTYVVRVRASPRGGFDARLDVAREGEAPTTREVHAASCVAAVTSMAVFVTLALAPTDEIDGDASTEPADEGSAPSPGQRPSSEPRAQPSGPARSRPTASPSVVEPQVGKPSAPASLVWTGGASFVAAGLGARALGARVSGELARVPASERLGMALRVSWGWADFSLFPPRAGEARFRLRTTRAEPCLNLSWAPLSIAACGAAELGTLSATAVGLPVSGRATMDWIAAGASARVRVHLVHGLSLEVGMSALAPFVRRTFALAEPVRGVFRPDAVLVEGALGGQMSATF